MKVLFFFTVFLLIFTFSKVNANSCMSNSEKLLYTIIERAKENKADSMQIGNLIAWVGQQFLETPYVASTLEVNKKEKCVFNLEGLDCVTFTENSIAIARCIKKGKTSYKDIIKELTLIRYKAGNIKGYSSRLHYSSEWIADGLKKSIFSDKTQFLGGKPIKFTCSFMSSNPQYYPEVLSKDTLMQKKIRENEEQINSQIFYYIPTEDISKVDYLFSNGDIVLLTSNKKGLDYNHLGIVIIDADGQKKLLHASSKLKKVVIAENIYEYVSNGSSNIGISILKPLEP